MSRLECALICWLLLLPRPGYGQSNLQVPVQFDFLDPGARSLALGSAFSPLGDDATAAVNNPAGLLQLTSPEISFEARGKRIDTSFLQGGRLTGPVTNRGIDTFAGPLYGDTRDTSIFPSFVSFVYPRARFAVAFYSHQFVEVNQAFQRTGVLGLFTTPAGVVQDAREPPQRVARDVSIVTHGVAAAFRVHRKLAIGVGVSFNDFKFQEVSTRFATEGIDLISFDPVHPSVYGGPDFSRGASGGFSSRREVVSPRIEGDDVAGAFTAGLLWTVNPHITVGAVMRQSPTFDYDLILPDQTRTPGRFAVPDTYTAGVAIRPTDYITAVVDYSHVRYSALQKGFVDVIVGPDGSPQQFILDDGDEVHVGVEYVFADVRTSPAIRLGGWYDPAHGVRFERSSLLNPFFNDLFAAALSGGENLVHYTFGFGLSLSRHVEINGAADLTSRNTLISTSAIFRF